MILSVCEGWLLKCQTMVKNNFINSEVAIEIALQQVPGQVIKVELDSENGVIVYEIYISTTYGIYEVDINARTGQIIKIEREFD